MNKKDIEKIMKGLFGNDNRSKAIILCRKNIIQLEAYFYEPGYEYFIPTCSIKLNKNLLFMQTSRNVEAYRNEVVNHGKYENIDDAIQEVLSVVKNKRCRVYYPKEKKNIQLERER